MKTLDGHQPETEVNPPPSASVTGALLGQQDLATDSPLPVIKCTTPDEDNAEDNNNELLNSNHDHRRSPLTSLYDGLNTPDAIGTDLPPKGHSGWSSEVASTAPSDFSHGDDDVDDDLGDISEISLPMPPDGGWGWVVCFAAFVCMLILDGMLFSFGVFYLDLLEYFGESKGLTAWVGSTLMGTHLIVGPFTSTLVNLWGVRKTAIVGVFVAAIGFISSVYVPSIPWLIVMYGVVGGIGVSMIYIPALLIVGFYFEKKRALANGLANSGSGFGAFIYAPLTRFLQDEFSWRGALLILSAVLLNCLVCAALFRPVEYKNLVGQTTPNESTTGTGDEEKQLISQKMFDKKLMDLKLSKSQSHTNVAHRSPALGREVLLKGRKGSMPVVDGISGSGQQLHVPVRTMQTSHTFHSASHIMHRSGLIYRSVGANLQGSTPVHLSSEIIQKPMYRKDIFYSGSVMKLPEMADEVGAGDGRSFPGSVLRIPDAPSTDSDRSSQLLECREITYILQQLMGTTLLKDPVFLLCVFMSVLWTTHATVLSILPDYAVQRGVGKSQAGFLLSIIGVSNIVGRLAAGCLADRPQLDAVVINAGALLVGGITCFVIPFTTNHTSLATLAAVFGLCMGTWTSLRPIILVQLLGLNNFALAFGMVAMFQGIAFMLGPPVAAHASVLAILPDYAVQRGVGKAQAGFLLSIIGVSNIVGRVAAGYLADRPQLDVVLINAAALLVGGITCFAIPATDQFPLLVAEAAVFGLCMATWTSLRPIMLVHLLGLEHLTNAFGLLAMFQGVAFCVGTPVAGWLFDYTQSYRIPFLCAGAAFVTSSLSCIPMKRVAMWQKKQESVHEISELAL